MAGGVHHQRAELLDRLTPEILLDPVERDHPSVVCQQKFEEITRPLPLPRLQRHLPSVSRYREASERDDRQAGIGRVDRRERILGERCRLRLVPGRIFTLYCCVQSLLHQQGILFGELEAFGMVAEVVVLQFTKEDTGPLRRGRVEDAACQLAHGVLRLLKNLLVAGLRSKRSEFQECLLMVQKEPCFGRSLDRLLQEFLRLPEFPLNPAEVGEPDGDRSQLGDAVDLARDLQTLGQRTLGPLILPAGDIDLPDRVEHRALRSTSSRRPCQLKRAEKTGEGTSQVIVPLVVTREEVEGDRFGKGVVRCAGEVHRSEVILDDQLVLADRLVDLGDLLQSDRLDVGQVLPIGKVERATQQLKCLFVGAEAHRHEAGVAEGESGTPEILRSLPLLADLQLVLQSCGDLSGLAQQATGCLASGGQEDPESLFFGALSDLCEHLLRPSVVSEVEMGNRLAIVARQNQRGSVDLLPEPNHLPKELDCLLPSAEYRDGEGAGVSDRSGDQGETSGRFDLRKAGLECRNRLLWCCPDSGGQSESVVRDCADDR